MSENDYIAEYVKEKYPSILGVDFGIWKTVRMVGDMLRNIAEAFSDHESEDKE